MFKKTLILILSSFVGIVASPNFLSASSDIQVTEINNSGIVKTVIPEPVQPAAQTVRTAKTAKIPANRITIGGRTIAVEQSSDTRIDAGSVVKFYNNRFLYGHNSRNVFGFLNKNMKGMTFSLTYNGVTTNYKIMDAKIYKKASQTSLYDEEADKTYGMTYISKGMNKYSLTLMTCSGTSYGNGDASHRLVLYANAI